MAKAVTKTVKPKVAEALPFYKKHPFQLVVVLFALLLFSNSLFNDYNLDDELVTRNHRLTSKGISAIPEIFTSPYYQDAMGYAYDYRPVPLSTFAIEHSVFGDKAGVSHFINLLLYALLCFCLFRLLVSIGGEITPFAALCITLLFCAHTSHTEVVCSIKNRDEILGLLFCVLAMQSALTAARKVSWWRIIVSSLLFLLAMLCKSTFLPFAFLIPLAVILFTESSFALLMSLTALLSIISYAVLDVNPAYFKLWMAVLLITGVAGLHQFLNRTVSITTIRNFFKNNQAATSVPGMPFSGLRQWLAEFNVTSLYSLVPAILILIVYAKVHTNTSWLLILVAVLLIVSLFLSFLKVKYWSFSAGLALATVFMGMAGVRFLLEHIATIGFDPTSPLQLLYILIIFLFFWGGNTVRLPALLSLPLVVYYMGDVSRQGFDIFQISMLFLLGRTKIGPKALKVLLLLFAVYTIDSIHTAFRLQRIAYFDFSQPILLIMVLAMLNWRNSWIFLVKKIDWVLATFTILMFAFLALEFSPAVLATVYPKKDYLNVAKTVVEKKTDRPLSYIEYPVPPGSPMGIKLGTSLVVLGHYLTKTIVPYPLSFYYGYSFISPTDVKNVVPILVLLLYLSILLTALFLIRRNKYLSFALLVFLLSSFMFSGFFLPVPGIVADRYLLVPSLGWSIILTLLLFRIGKVKNTNPNLAQISRLPKAFVYSLTVILCFYSVLTFSRNFDWKNDLTLFRHDISYVSNSAQANNLLAEHLMNYCNETKDPTLQTAARNEALTHFKSALKIYPDFYNAAFSIGAAYRILNIPDSVFTYFRRAISIDPSNSDAHLIIARLLIDQNRFQEAIPYYEFRIRSIPADYSAYEELSFAHYSVKDYNKSLAVNAWAVKLFPSIPQPLVNIGRTYVSMNKPDSARIYFQRGLLVSPGNQNILALLEEVNKGTK